MALGHPAIDYTTADPGVYDITYYERENAPIPSGTIALDWVSVQIGTGPSGACASGSWYTVFNWGDGDSSNNGHLGASFPEIDNQTIPMANLYGTWAHQTGIRIDFDTLAAPPPTGTYPCVRIYSPINWPDNDPAEMDALEICFPGGCSPPLTKGAGIPDQLKSLANPKASAKGTPHTSIP